MAVLAKDGSRHHSAGRASLHDSMAANRGKAAGVQQMKPMAEGSGGPAHLPGPSETPIEDHVEEHGPAHAVQYTHDKASKVHHVSSFHGEAAKGDNDHPGAHHSHHKTSAAAHEHMGKSMGMDHENEEKPEQEDDETPDSGTDQMAGAHAIPGLD